MPRRHPSLSLVVSLLALVLASAGAGYAAGALPANSVGTAQLKPRSVTVGKLAPGAVSALKGHRGTIGPRGPVGPAGRSALTTLKSGETERGAWAVAGGKSGEDHVAITLTIPAPQPLDDAHVSVDNNNEDLGECAGTLAAPAAKPGYLCFYVADSDHTSYGLGFGVRHDFSSFTDAADTGTRYGGTIVVGGDGGGDFSSAGTWTYTAP